MFVCVSDDLASNGLLNRVRAAVWDTIDTREAPLHLLPANLLCNTIGPFSKSLRCTYSHTATDTQTRIDTHANTRPLANKIHGHLKQQETFKEYIHLYSICVFMHTQIAHIFLAELLINILINSKVACWCCRGNKNNVWPRSQQGQVLRLVLTYC